MLCSGFVSLVNESRDSFVSHWRRTSYSLVGVIASPNTAFLSENIIPLQLTYISALFRCVIQVNFIEWSTFAAVQVTKQFTDRVNGVLHGGHLWVAD